ncbi:beta-ketoacyl synthase N-terminal-like domain-containing protein [Kutzneria sp. NPDC052558]|uniref:type I polyketide synthase n=1 Tax=Kutzneria sp. NPDC052558 TaxID=3364121 RepID=UPI0037CB0DAC
MAGAGRLSISPQTATAAVLAAGARCRASVFTEVGREQEVPVGGTRQPRHEFIPIAVIGAGCRFAPDLDSLDDFWSFVMGGGNAVSDIPAMRLEPYVDGNPQLASVLRKASTRAAYLADVDGFDATFFGVSPREAAVTDPQQRLFLEVVWEALEHAGMDPLSLAGTDTGVYAGVTFAEYGRRTLEDLTDVEPWAGMGSTYYAVANRVSYFLDLHGESLAVDTACASSLTAVDLACERLAAGRISCAIVGGVSVLPTPHGFVALDEMGATSPDGRSKSFSADADGYGRGEGAGAVVLKRLDDATAAGDRVLAVIKASVSRHEGRTQAIMVPSADGQAAMLTEAYELAGILPEAVDYIEAHGTGTPVGDPIEAAALAAVVGRGRPAAQPCLIGSVKPNIGHLEAASGIAGLIKTVLAVHHGRIPPSVGVTTPNPDIPWEDNGLRLVTEPTPWPNHGGPRRAGVSCYGYGGSISHIVVEQAPETAKPPRGNASPDATVVPVSGRTEAALRANAANLADWLESSPDNDFGAFAATLARRRAHLASRAAVVGDRDAVLAGLRALAADEPADGLVTAEALHRQDPVWVFSGYGSHWVGMGRELAATEPVFAAVIDDLDPVFEQELGIGAHALLAGDDQSHVDAMQAATFAMQVGLAALWRSHGVVPAAVLGQSLGEYAAAVVSGALTLADAARGVCRRAKIMRRVEGEGAMALVYLDFDTVVARLAGRADLAAAITSSPSSTVVSGDIASVEALLAECEVEGVKAFRVNTPVAYHSHHLRPLGDDVIAALSDIEANPLTLKAYNTTLADPRAETSRDAAFWAVNMYEMCRFTSAVQAAVEDGHRLFVEVSPHPLVVHSVNEILAGEGVIVHTLRRNEPERTRFRTALATVHCHGAPLDWSRVHPDLALVDLPTNAWQHRPYWHNGKASTADAGHDPDSHTLLGAEIAIGGGSPTRLWQTTLDEASRPYPGTHPVHGVEIVPAAVLLNTFLAGGDLTALTDVNLRIPLAVEPPRDVQVIRQGRVLTLASRPQGEADDNWLTHTTAVASSGNRLEANDFPDFAAAWKRCAEVLDGDAVPALMAEMGADGLGFDWRATELRRGDAEMFARMTMGGGPLSWAHALDAAVTLTPLVLPDRDGQRMPAHIELLAVADTVPPNEIQVAARVSPASPLDSVDVWVADAAGTPVAVVRGVRFGLLDSVDSAVTDPRRLVHELIWRPLPDPEPTHRMADPRLAVILSDDDEFVREIASQLVAGGLRCVHVREPEELPDLRDDFHEPSVVLFAPAIPAAGESLAEAAAATTWRYTRTAQHLNGLGAAVEPRLWCLTRGVRSAASAASVAHAPLWGAGRVTANEHPEFWGGVIDFADGIEGLLGVLRAAPRDDILSLTRGDIEVSRLSAIDRSPDQSAVELRADATYLVTGGLGDLGLEVAAWLVGRGARRLVLAGRTPLPPRRKWPLVTDPAVRRQIEAVIALESLGVAVHPVALDIADAGKTIKVLDGLQLPPIRGVVHAAGVLHDQLVAQVDHAAQAKVLRPKVAGALVLHELFPPGSLDFLVLFSSCGQVFQVPGQLSYAAANSVLDTLAAHRGDNTQSLAWTAWRGRGMAAGAGAALAAVMAAQGTTDLSTVDAFRCWEWAERFHRPYLAVLPLTPLAPGERRLPVFGELAADEPADDRTEDWGELTLDRLAELVTSAVATELRLPEAELDARRPLTEMGIDSVMSIAIRGRLQRQLRVDLPATLLWTYPSVQRIAEFVAGLLGVEELV